MKITAQAALWGCVVFGLVCVGFSLTGFMSLSTIADEADREASLGYAWFWAFLALIAVVFGILSWFIKEGKFGQVE